MVIRQINISRLKTELSEAYNVSSGSVPYFEPILIEVSDGQHSGWGEATIFYGYTLETVHGGWVVSNWAAKKIIGKEVEEAQQFLKTVIDPFSHAAAAMSTAISMMSNDSRLNTTEIARIPVLATVNAFSADQAYDETKKKVDQGYRTLKVKIGRDVGEDLIRLDSIQKAVCDGIQIRLDANQAYTAEQALQFLSQLNPRNIQLLEQPCFMIDWEANLDVASNSPVPIMLDESIYSMADIERAAAARNIEFVKLKLMKSGNFEKLQLGIDAIHRGGMSAVIGNGAATDLSCWMEATSAGPLLKCAGEMNGFLKLAQPLFQNPMEILDGEITLPPNYWPELDRAAIDAQTVDYIAITDKD